MSDRENPEDFFEPSDTSSIARNLGDAFDRLHEMASRTAPDVPGDKDPFFSHAQRALIGDVILALQQRRPGSWCARDVVTILSSESYTREILSGESLPDKRDL